MMADFYPDLVSSLPDADIPVAGVQGKLLQGEHGQVVFFDLAANAKVPPHAHGAQWGVVLEGGRDGVDHRGQDSYVS